MTIIAAADGSSLGNPGPAGWCWYIDNMSWEAGGWPRGTNNMGELQAVLALLEATSHTSEPLRILCDSQYVINSVTKWRHGWKRNGWKKKDGKPVLNVDYMKALDKALEGRTVDFEWVKGHAGHPLNEAADERARAVATAYHHRTTPVTGPGFAGAPAESCITGGASSGADEATAPIQRAEGSDVESCAAPTLFDAVGGDDVADDHCTMLEDAAEALSRLTGRSVERASDRAPEACVVDASTGNPRVITREAAQWLETVGAWTTTPTVSRDSAVTLSLLDGRDSRCTVSTTWRFGTQGWKAVAIVVIEGAK